MSRRYDDPVDVRRRNDVPAEFLWNGRLHLVRAVLAHWVEAGAWWSGAAVHALHGTPAVVGAGDDGLGHTFDAGPFDAGAGIPEPAGGSLAVDDGESEVWRVEASAGRSAGSGVYDLRFAWSTGSWTLARTLD